MTSALRHHVTVHYLAPTDLKPARYCATSASGRTFYRPTDLGASDEANRDAARAAHLARIDADGRVSVEERANRERRAKRTPRWLTAADGRAIAQVYRKARRLTRETGIAHHVDHEYPLLGDRVSGLHVPGNVRVMTAAANAQKGNRYASFTLTLDMFD